MTIEDLNKLKTKIDKIKEGNIIAENKKKELETLISEKGYSNIDELEADLEKKKEEKVKLEALILEKMEMIEKQLGDNT